MAIVKKIILWGALGAVLYILLSNHFIFVDGNCKILKKSKLTLNQTFFSTQGRTAESILAIDELREDGIAELLVEMGWMTESQKDRLLERYD